jgi:mono/diheme cytochrome c family protein
LTAYKKHWILLCSAALSFLLTQCATGDKITYQIPPRQTAEKRKEIIADFDKGKELFRINCAECHGIFSGGKEKVPNFTTEQVDNYSARFLRHDAKNHAVTKQMSPEQLGEILTFLKFRKMKKTTA